MDKSHPTARSSCTKCSPLTLSDNQDPINDICPINFIDLSQFKDINIDIYPYGDEFNERATIGFWIFFADLTGSRSLENDIYHVVLKNRIVISLVPGDDKIISYCHSFEDLYRKVTSDTKLYSYYSDKNSEYVVSDVIPSSKQKDGLEFETMNGKWFHVSCGISFDHRKLYLKSVVNGINSVHNKSLPLEKLYPGSGVNNDGESDFFFSHIINKGDPLTLSIKNFGNSNAKIYVRHLIFFKELMDENLQYMYFDLTDVGAKEFPEIVYQLPLKELYFESPYRIKGYQYDYPDEIKNYDILLESSHADREDFYPPLNFYRIILNTPNKAYKRIDLKEVSGEIERDLDDSFSNANYVYDDNKLLHCKDGYFYYYTGTPPTFQCNPSKCGAGYITYPGVLTSTTSTGYCDYAHLINNADFDYNNNKFCSNYPLTYNLFFNCLDDTKNYYMQYSGFYNSQTLKIDLAQSLSSYIIEFWFYPDFFLQAKARQTQFTYPTYTKNYFFHSNVMDCYFVQTDRLIPYLYDSKTIKQVTTLYNSNEWNKFVIHGKYLKDSDDYIKTVYVNHAFDQPFAFAAAKASTTTSLSSIIFCENKCQDIDGQNIHWTTGYYKDLRIWNGDLASYSEVVQYNDFYPPTSADYKKTINAILCYYPLYNQYIANNKITDLDTSKSNCKISLDHGTYNLKKYNYRYKVDIIEGNGLDQKYSKHGSDPAFIDTCDNGCSRCWERTFCYKCQSGYFLSGRKCLIISKKYFRSPPIPKADSTLNFADITNGVTISFWTKPMGFENNVQEILTIGSSNSLSLYYSSEDDPAPAYGLYILGNNAGITDNKNKIIACESEFRDNMGKWTFISIAYHKQKNYVNPDSFFPRMMKFEINTDSIPVDIEGNKIINDPNFSTITIKKGYFGLFSPVKFYNEFIIQAITYEKSNQLTAPFSVPIPTLQLTCSSSDTNCVADEEPDLGLFIDSCSLYQDTLTTDNSCLNLCSGNGWERCTCWAQNYNSQMLLKNDNKTLCRPLDYINFAKMEPIKITGLSSASSSKKCTLQFWMFAYSYSPNGFGGITFDWKGHNKIKLDCSDYSCKFTCYQKDASGQTLKIEDIKINQWVFLSCAVDYDKKIMYINATTEDNINSYADHTNVIDDIPSPTSELTISDDSSYDEWGILFFRQIRLWKNAFFNPEFLSRVLIETPSKFPDLLHSWEPVYNGKMVDAYAQNNLKVVDIVDSSKEFTVYYGPSNKLFRTYGMNVIDESKYSILTMCSEDGLYYDVTLKRCMQFLDLSKMNDFTFKDLPSGYSGNYALAFWVFFEQADLYKNDGLHISWSRHLEITIQVDDFLKGYCLPQGYYTDYESNDPTFLTRYNDALNKADLRLLPEGLSEDGNWIWVICSVSYYKRNFYMMGNYGNTNEQNIIPEVLIPGTGGAGTETRTSYPMRFYLSDLNNNNMYKSKLSVTNINPNKKLYLREILLFRNYIPTWYAEKIKYMNMKDLSNNELPALAFVANFADFDLDTKKLKYYIYERGYGATTYEKVESSLLLTVRNAGSTFELSANFNFQSLCDLSANNPNKYDPENKICVTINNCNLQDLKALYCMDEYVPIACQAGSLITQVELDEVDDKGNKIKRINCTSQCEVEEFITPGTPKDRGICNAECDLVTKDNNGKCPITAKSMACQDGNDGTH